MTITTHIEVSWQTYRHSSFVFEAFQNWRKVCPEPGQAGAAEAGMVSRLDKEGQIFLKLVLETLPWYWTCIDFQRQTTGLDNRETLFCLSKIYLLLIDNLFCLKHLTCKHKIGWREKLRNPKESLHTRQGLRWLLNEFVSINYHYLFL